jgi:hypothetical protein
MKLAAASTSAPAAKASIHGTLPASVISPIASMAHAPAIDFDARGLILKGIGCCIFKAGGAI